MLFKELQLIEPILKALETEGYSTPTPIQEQAIPLALEGRDLLGCAQTGTGKTAAFAIPILQLVYQSIQKGNRSKTIKALVLTPTRELAIQIDESFAAYGRYLYLKHQVIFGGVSQVPQVNALRNGVDILVATPGRLLDLMQQGYIKLHEIDFFVLDEADRMLDMGFINDVKKIVAKLPAKKQTFFFSATMPTEIEKLSATLLHQPAKVEVTPVSSTVEKIEQAVYYVEKDQKKHLLIHLLKDKAIQTALVFTRTKHGADKVVKELTRVGISTEAIHGNKSQNARQRALTNFKSGATRILVATDIAARGIDVDQLSHVFNYELPNVPETYVHRIGRTGRAGASGIAVSFCDTEERAYLKDIQKLIKINLPVVKEHEFASTVPLNAIVQETKKSKPAPRGRFRDQRSSYNRTAQKR
ncbi:MAG: DEAD/DEAH box helicase [Sediminibacterium sp.]|nr:DEAD/DEAH box helicase [Sediminibacterium sp.]